MAKQSDNSGTFRVPTCAGNAPGNAEVGDGVTDYAVFVFTSFLQQLANNAPQPAVPPEIAATSPGPSLRRSARLQVPAAGETRFSVLTPAAVVYNSTSTKVKPKPIQCLYFS